MGGAHAYRISSIISIVTDHFLYICCCKCFTNTFQIYKLCVVNKLYVAIINILLTLVIDNNISHRIEALINHFDLNPTTFSKKIGLTNNVTIGRLIRESRTPSLDVIQRIVSSFPSLSLDWLIKGEGEMFDNNVVESDFSNISIKAKLNKEQINFVNDAFIFSKNQVIENCEAVKMLLEKIKIQTRTETIEKVMEQLKEQGRLKN